VGLKKERRRRGLRVRVNSQAQKETNTTASFIYTTAKKAFEKERKGFEKKETRLVTDD
jgi:hypothetical protein